MSGQMQQALKDAKHPTATARERLAAAIAAAAGEYPFSRGAAILRLKEALRADGTLAVEFMELHWLDFRNALMDALRDQVAKVRTKDGGGQAKMPLPKGQSDDADPAAVAETPARAAGGDHFRCDTHKKSVPAGSDRSIHASDELTITETGASPGGRGQRAYDKKLMHVSPAKPNRVGAVGRAAVAALVRKALLDEYAIDGKALRFCTAAEVDTHRAKNATRDRWLELLTRNLPPSAVIGEWRTDDDADKLWRAAQETTA